MIKAVTALIVSLPEVIKLINRILKKIELENKNKRVKDELKKINQAFEKRNADLLNDVFNGVRTKPASDNERKEP